MSLDELIAYFEAAFETCVVIKTRLARAEMDSRNAIRDVGRLQSMVRGYLDALYETKRMTTQHGDTGSS